MNFKSRRRSRKLGGAINYETMEQRKLLAAVIPNFIGDGQIGEVATIQVNSNWATVNLDQTFNNPVVIAGPASSANGDPLTVRVRNVGSTSFQIALDEWDYLDGSHSSETVSYMVVEGGTHELTDGTRLVAGYVPGQTHEVETFSTGDFFDSTPVLFSQIMTDNDPASATTRTLVLSDNLFALRIQEEEGADDVHASETVGFVALEMATQGSSGDLAFQSFVTPDNVTHTGTTVSLGSGLFSSTPALFANMQTANGIDSATVRSTAINSSSASFFIEEEQSQDAELIYFGDSVGVLAIDNGDIIAGIPLNASDRFSDLEEHIRGIDTLTVGQLQSWANGFSNEAGSLGNRLDDFLAAVEVVELYEELVGPLFTSQGVSSFNNSWDGDLNLGRGLGRAMLGVYQAIFDAYGNDLISENPDLVQGTFFRSTENFPGSVPNPTDPTAIYEVQIDGTLNEEFGYVGGYSTNAARRMTGAYLAPGTIVEVIVPNELVNAGYQIRVGGHSWDLSNKNTANRLLRVSNLFDITDNVVQVANPMGGNIYIEVPVGADAGIVDVQFRNTIRAPFFSNRTFDQTSQSEWNVERTHPGAFTDIESEHSMWTVPTKWVTNLGYAQLMEIIEAHDANIQVATEYAGKNPTRHKASLYMIVDTQIRGNAFSIGYPQSNYGTFSQNTIRGPLTLANAFDKVLWHEHGHSEFLTMFSGETESLVHMAAFYIGVENYGFTIQEAFGESLAFGSTNHTTSDTLNSWVVMDEFINGQNMAFQQGSYRPRGHADYVEYVELFGLDALRNYNRRINIEFDGTNLNDSFNEGGRTSHNANDRILRLSREAGVNVAPLFHMWGHAPSNASALNAALAAEGLGDSVQIYDRMIEARDSVPLTQAQWNAVDGVMRDFLNEARGPWQELRTNYDVDRGQDAIDRIQEIIDQHFPSGRPSEGPAVVPIAASVVAFADPDFGGERWELAEGTYLNVDLAAGPIGNDAISSILIPAGYEVTVYQWSGGTGTTQTYTDSISTLGILDNDVSRVEVTFTQDNQQAIGESSTVSLDAAWKTVTLTQSYNDPVVIAGTPSYEGVDPSTVRIRNVTSNSFEIQVDEWEYLNPFHATEVVSYMVVEAGHYRLDDGTTIVAGNRTGQDHNVQTYSLGSAFQGLDSPLVFANVITQSDPTAVTTRVNVTSNSEFEIRLQEEEAADGVRGAETVSYFAVESGAGATGGLHYDAGAFEAGDGGQFVDFDSRVNLSSVDSFFAGMQTINGIDTTTLRNTVFNAAGATVFTEEERSADTEIAHSAETIGFFAINEGIIMGRVATVENFEVGIGGTQPGTEYDTFATDSLSGNLTVSLTNGFVPSSSDVFFIAQAPVFFNGGFENVENGQRIQTTGDEGSFLVAITNNLVILSGYEPSQPFLLGDTNQDGIVSFLDIDPFITVLSSNSYLSEADANQDGVVDFLDINPFILLLSQQ